MTPAPVTRRPVHVLIIEDDGGLRGVLARNLAGHGYRVAEAESAEDATIQLEAGLRPSLVLLDLNLPGATGWDLLRAGTIAAAGRPYVVATTATTVHPHRLTELGVDGYLPKPFAMETLLATVARFAEVSRES